MTQRRFKGRSYNGAPGSGRKVAARRYTRYGPRPAAAWQARQSSGEMKFFDTRVDDAVVSATMTISNLCIIPEGNGESARIGRKITIKKIHVKGALTLPAATGSANTSDKVICMLVQDKQTNGAIFLPANFVDTDVFDSFRNLAESSRFRVLYKKVFTVNAGGAAASGAAFTFSENVRSINCNVNCTVPIEYNNTADDGTIATVRSNNLYWVTQSSAGITAIVANVRVRYTD